MAIFGLGTDIVEIQRIAKVHDRTGDRLAQRILTANELAQYQVSAQPVRFLAKRFAVKEAAAKALGTGIRSGLAFNQFEVCNDALGKPCLHLHGVAAEMAARYGITHLHVTIADERHYAVATVLLEC